MSDVTTSTAWIEYDYAIVRVVPRVHVCTFQNIGVLLHARTIGFIDAKVVVDETRLRSSCPGIDLDTLERFVDAYVRVCRGEPGAAPVSMLPPSERFHWLTSPRSGVLQTSEVHPGRTRRIETELDLLFERHCG